MKPNDLIKGSTNSILFSHKIKEQEQKEDELIHQIIFKKYEVKKKCGKTSTIDIYEGLSKENNNPVIIKVENKSQEKLYLESEAYNLFTFKGFGIPELIKFGKRKNDIILIQSKLGRSLNELFVENNKKFSLNEICLIGIQCIERLQWIHSKNYVYRNIKPENFLIGIDDPHVIYLQNFYLCEKYKSSKTNQHAKFKYTKEIVGTERYGSINALRGLRQGRKDDLESLCYMLIYFFLGKLPWQGLKASNEVLKHENLLKEKKNFKIEKYKQIPKEFCNLFKYVKGLKFEQEPKYSIMIRLLQKILTENQCFNNTNFFWIKKNNICLGTNIKTKKEGFRQRLIGKIENNIQKKNTTTEYQRKLAKSKDLFENLGKEYIDDDEDDEEEDNNYEISAFQVKVNNKMSDDDESSNENKEESDNNESKENDLNNSNSSINTKIFKLKGEIEKIVKRDLMNDSDIDNFEESQNANPSKLSRDNEVNRINSIKKSEKLKIDCNEIIHEEPINEEEEENDKGNEEIKESIPENNVIENNKNYVIDKSKTFVSSNSNGTTKQDSTKESIQYNNKESEIKNNNNNQGSLIIVKNSNNNNKNQNINNNKENINIVSSNKKKNKKKSLDKILISKKDSNKYGQIKGPNESLTRSKSIITKSTKKDKNKDCLIF